MSEEELKQRLIELVLTDVECDKDGHGDCSTCEYRYSDDNCFKYYSRAITDFLIANGVTIRKRGEWILEHETYGKMICSACKKECSIERKPDPYAEFQMTDLYIESDFCPHCGADMRGVTETEKGGD